LEREEEREGALYLEDDDDPPAEISFIFNFKMVNFEIEFWKKTKKYPGSLKERKIYQFYFKIVKSWENRQNK
jgi:hypothetical protein